MDYKNILLSPIKIGSKEAQNRFFVQAMECNDEDKDGNPSDLTYKRYEDLFEGEAGIISLEAISVTRESRSRINQLTIMPQNEKALTAFVAKVRAYNPNVIFVFQLTHSGELSEPSFSKRVTVNPLYGFGGDLLTDEDIDKIVEDFVQAAVIAHNAGADGIDMKLCHGYLGGQVLRPHNSRKWKYGGSWENRSRFAFDLYEKIQKAVNDKNFLIGSKISAYEGFPGGFGTEGPDSPIMDLTEPLSLLKGLEERGAQYFVQSAGSPSTTIYLTQAGKDAPYFSYLHQYFAKEFKKAVKPETVIMGSNFSLYRDGNNGLRSVEPEKSSLLYFGAQCIETGVMDMVALGRQSLADPYTPKKLRENNENDIKYCTACDNCKELLIRQRHVGCATYNKHYTQELINVRKELGKLTITHT